MASKPIFDKDRGRWRMKWWSGPEPDQGWKTAYLCPHPGWTKGDKAPKRPPPEAEVAARKYHDLEAKARLGVRVTVRARGHDLRVHLTQYRERFAREKAEGSLDTLDRSIRLFLEHCGRVKIATVEAVTVKTCRDYMHWRFETVGHATIKAERGLLSKVWTNARLDGIVPENPWHMVRPPGKPNSDPPPYWTEAELNRLVAASSGWLRDLILVGANTGLRISALLAIEWRDVAFERGDLIIRQEIDKAGRGYRVPLNKTAEEVLARRKGDRKDGAQLVFPRPLSGRRMRSSDPYDRMKGLVHRLGLPDHGSYNHILRHTFATHAVMRGVPLLIVSSWLGHSSIKTTEVYSHVIPSESRQHMEKFDLSAPPVL